MSCNRCEEVGVDGFWGFLTVLVVVVFLPVTCANRLMFAFRGADFFAGLRLGVFAIICSVQPKLSAFLKKCYNMGVDKKLGFKPNTWNWIVTVVVGWVAPFGLNRWLIGLISGLDTTLVSATDTVNPATPILSSLMLVTVCFLYLVVLVYQVRFLALHPTHPSVWALITTLVGPVVVLLLVPFWLAL